LLLDCVDVFKTLCTVLAVIVPFKATYLRESGFSTLLLIKMNLGNHMHRQ